MTEKQKKKSTHFPQRKYAVKVRTNLLLEIGLHNCGAVLLEIFGIWWLIVHTG